MKEFESNMVSIHGDEGQEWLNNLPSLVASIAKKYSLYQLCPVSNLTFNYVVRGYQNKKLIILKVGMDKKALEKEAACLKIFSSYGAIDVLASDSSMILMELANPGVSLKEFFPGNDEKASNILCSVIKKLHSAELPKEHAFQHVSELLKAFDDNSTIPKQVLNKARFLRDNLLDSCKQEVLLHGDLHHDNIIKNNDAWVAIDPKGFVGDPAFELAAYLSNPIPVLLEQDSPREIIRKRIYFFSKQLELSEKRIKDWLYVKSALCWVWSLQDNLDSRYWERLLEVLF